MEKIHHCQIINTLNVTSRHGAAILLENINNQFSIKDRVLVRLEQLRKQVIVSDNFIKEE